MKILFIGNSYTYYNDLWDIVKSIYKSQGQDIEVDHYTIGGATLKQLFFEDEESDPIIIPKQETAEVEAPEEAPEEAPVEE